MNIIHLAKTLTFASLLFTCAACSSTSRTETSSNRSTDAILAELTAAEYPTFDSERRGDREYVNAYYAQQQQVATRRAPLALALYNKDPHHEQVPDLMAERWQTMTNVLSRENPAVLGTLRTELATVLSRHSDESPLVAKARLARVNLAMSDLFMRDGSPDDALAVVEQFIEKAPDDPQAATFLYQIAAYGYEGNSPQQIRLLTRVKDTYGDMDDPHAARAARSAAAQLTQLAAIGERFDFAFTCAVTGSEVETASLAGKVVVIDFWATWCGPCIAEMPKMKDLYAKYRDRGVEFIGISLDQPIEQGGRDKLLAYVNDNDVQWPQWYQGNGWQSEFSSKWGINGIPTLFIVDAEGRLRSTTARGKLEELIVELLAERDAAVTQRSSL